METQKNSDVIGRNIDSRLEEILAKVEKNDDLTLEEFNYFIDSFFDDFKSKLDDILCRIMEIRILTPPSEDDFYYLIKLSEYEKTNSKANSYKKIIDNLKEQVNTSINMVLANPKARNVIFLLSQRKLFDEFCSVLLDNLNSCFEWENNLEIEKKFYYVKIKMLENMEDIEKDNEVYVYRK